MKAIELESRTAIWRCKSNRFILAWRWIYLSWFFPVTNSAFMCWHVAAYRTSLRQLRRAVSALESFVTNHLQYQHADDVRMVNTVAVQFDSVVSRLVHTATTIMDRYHVNTDGRLGVYGRVTAVDYESCQCANTVDSDVLLAADLSRLLSHIRTATRIISLTTHWTLSACLVNVYCGKMADLTRSICHLCRLAQVTMY